MCRAASSNDFVWIERGDLGLVGEQDVDRGANELEELGPMPVHAEGIREAERDLPSRLGAAISAACRNAALASAVVEQIALEIDDARGGD